MPSEGYGGLELQTFARAKDALYLGHNSLMFISPNTILATEVINSGMKYNFLKINFDYVDIFSALRLSKLINKHNLDVLIVSQSKLLSFAIISRYITQKRYKKDFAIIFYQHLQSKIVKKDFFHNWIYRQIDGAITFTKGMMTDLLETTVIEENKIDIIPAGLKLDQFRPLLNSDEKLEILKKFNLPTDKFIVGYIARIERHKDQTTSIQSFYEANLPNAILVICGILADENYKYELEQLIIKLENQRKGFAENIYILGFTPLVNELIRTFDIFMMCSRSEAFGLVNIESLASGVPLIATNSGGIPEFIKDGFNGILFTREDPNEGSKKLKLLYNDKLLRDKIIKNGIEFVHQNYEYTKQRNLFFDFCNNIYENKFK